MSSQQLAPEFVLRQELFLFREKYFDRHLGEEDETDKNHWLNGPTRKRWEFPGSEAGVGYKAEGRRLYGEKAGERIKSKLRSRQ